MAKSNYDEKLKQKALTIANQAGAAEASKATGIPAGTIRSWIHRMQPKDETQRDAATQRRTQKLKALEEEAVEQAVEEAREYIVDRLKGLADKFYALAEESLDEARSFMTRVREKNGEDRDSAAWLRALVGAMHYGVQDGQLVSGKPTSREERKGEVKNIHEYKYDITLRDLMDAHRTGRSLDDLLGAPLQQRRTGVDSG